MQCTTEEALKALYGIERMRMQTKHKNQLMWVHNRLSSVLMAEHITDEDNNIYTETLFEGLQTSQYIKFKQEWLDVLKGNAQAIIDDYHNWAHNNHGWSEYDNYAIEGFELFLKLV